jgi:hypothetical protein
MGLIGNPALANNPAANGCLPAVQTLVSMGQWAYQMMFAALWANPQGLSIPDAFAVLGTAYAALAAEMDAQGPDWCREKLAAIVEVMQEEAARRRLPFVRSAAAALVKWAIRCARRDAERTPASAVDL